MDHRSWTGHHGHAVTISTSNSTPPGDLFGRSRAHVDQALPQREAVACPLCQREPRLFAVDFQGLHLARCQSCGLELQSPRPVFEQLASAVYGSRYHRADETVVDPIRRWQVERQMSWLERFVPAGRRRLLDVGCGAGAFIRFATERGWVVDGTDVVVTDGARATGARLWEGQLPVIEFGVCRFDVVRFNHVLEHTQDPLAELRRARSLLTTNGLLHVGVPNVAGFSIRLKSWQSRLHLKSKLWKHYGALHHLWFFTPRTLARLADAAGFNVLQWETPVAGRPRRPGWVTAAIRGPLERARAGGILDLYARG